MSNQKTRLPEELKSIIFSRFTDLPIENKLVVYARLAHGNMFKAQNNDLFGLNRRIVSKIYRSFIDSLKKDYEDKSCRKS